MAHASPNVECGGPVKLGEKSNTDAVFATNPIREGEPLKHPANQPRLTNWSKPRLSIIEVNQSVQLCSDRDATSALSLGAQVKYSNTSHTHTRRRLLFSRLEAFFTGRGMTFLFFQNEQKKKINIKNKIQLKEGDGEVVCYIPEVLSP